MIFLKKNVMRWIISLFLVNYAYLSPVYAAVLIRDSETEQVLRDIMSPLLMAAYGTDKTVSLYIINDPNLNAFVQDGQKIFIHTGLILCTTTPQQLAGVLAHELGHIQGGHLVRTDSAATDAVLQSLITGGAIGIAAAASGAGAGGALSGAVLAGSQAGMGSMINFTRTQESSADQYALKILLKSGISTDGLIQVMQMLAQDEYGASDYMRSHPLSRDRIDLLSHESKHFSQIDSGKISLNQHAYDRIRAKLSGFVEPPERTIDNYKNNPDDDVKTLALASALHVSGQSRKAYNMMEDYFKNNPSADNHDGYMHDLAGQIATETGLRDKSIHHYQKAYHIYPNDILIQLLYASALVASEQPDHLKVAIPILKKALLSEKYYAKGYWDLSIAYDRLGQEYLAASASARYNQLIGNIDTARTQAKRAIAGLPENSSEYIQTKDILYFIKHNEYDMNQ